MGLHQLRVRTSMKAWRKAKLSPPDYRKYKAGEKSLTVDQAYDLAATMGYLLTFLPIAEMSAIEDAAITLNLAALDTPSTPVCVHEWLSAQGRADKGSKIGRRTRRASAAQ